MPELLTKDMASLAVPPEGDDQEVQWGHCTICGTWFIQDMGCPYCHGDPDHCKH